MWTSGQICHVMSAQTVPPPAPGTGESLNAGAFSSDCWPWIQHFLALISCTYSSKASPIIPILQKRKLRLSWKGQVDTEGQRGGGAGLRSPTEFLLEIGWPVELSAVTEMLRVQYGSQ